MLGRQRLGIEHIERYRPERAVIQRRHDVIFNLQPAAAGIAQPRSCAAGAAGRIGYGADGGDGVGFLLVGVCGVEGIGVGTLRRKRLGN